MTISIKHRLQALEAPGSGQCLSCATLPLNRRADGHPDMPAPSCWHWPRTTLAEELQDLNCKEGVAG